MNKIKIIWLEINHLESEWENLVLKKKELLNVFIKDLKFEK